MWFGNTRSEKEKEEVIVQKLLSLETHLLCRNTYKIKEKEEKPSVHTTLSIPKLSG